VYIYLLLMYYVVAMTRDIYVLTRKPELREKWISTTVEYICKKYGNPPAVDAIVGTHTKGNLFAVVVAYKLRLPYIATCKAGKNLAEPYDLIQRTYTNRENKVLLKNYCFVVV